MNPEYFFNDKSAILLHPQTRRNKNFVSHRHNDAQKMQGAQVTKSLLYSSCPHISLILLCDIDLLFTFQFFDCDRHIYIYDFTRAGVTQSSLKTNVMFV